MTAIRSFTIEGLAGRGEVVHHDLNDDVNVFWGRNGCGKTSMLRLLHSALNNDVRDLDRVQFDYAEVSIYSENYKRVFTRSIKKSEIVFERPTVQGWDEDDEGEIIIRADSDAKRTIGWKTKGPKTLHTKTFRHGWLPITRTSDVPNFHRSRRRRREIGPVLTESDIDRVFADGIQERWHHWSFESSRQIREAQDQALTDILEVALLGARTPRQRGDQVPAEEAYKLVTDFFGGRRQLARFEFKSFDEFKSRYNGKTILPDIVQRLQSVEERIEEAQKPQKRLEELISELFSQGREIDFSGEEITVSVNGDRIALGHLSSGERQLLLILLECLRGETSTIIVDEPELSMHVDWQNVLVNAMRIVNPRSQLIMATHSPEVMAELEDRCVIEL
ncbi:AAA family ATPase [Rhodococcus koreensis]|uniref:AAA family ATPase n=1 Tax=Rhodococcus koreensis TaxID=99653 RepID=UPI00366E19F9